MKFMFNLNNYCRLIPRYKDRECESERKKKGGMERRKMRGEREGGERDKGERHVLGKTRLEDCIVWSLRELE